ncbi:hypothetical protein AX14_010217 [Amanita brunnescens Koide BX004]|nr:hypothetical protein AX14_010217 [Amanita brunnescens Koide BX004]
MYLTTDPKDSNSIAAEPDDTLAERIGLLGHDLSKFADGLDPSDTVFSIFPTQPPGDHIHIIVKVRAAGGSGEKNRNIDAINEEIKAELKLLQPIVEAFLKNPELPIWVPPQHAMRDIQKFITDLIPTYGNLWVPADYLWSVPIPAYQTPVQVQA